MNPASRMPRGRLAFILGALAMLGPFSIDTVFPAFPQVAAALSVNKLAMQQTISAYLLGYAAMSLFHGALSDAIGRRPVIMAGLVVFTLASIGCALAPTMPMLLGFRVLQGLSAGVGLIVGRAIIRDVLDGDDAQRLMSQVSMIFAIAPAIAPVVGGWILGWGDWRAIFWFLALFGLAVTLLAGFALPESHPQERRLPLKVSALVNTYRQIIGNRRFRLLAYAGTLNFGALFLYIASAPAFVLDLLRLGQNDFVWFFAPTIGGMMLGAFLSGRYAGRVPPRRMVAIGLACCGVAALGNIGYNLFDTTPTLPWAVLPTALLAFGIALVFPILTILILDLFPNQRGSASSMQAFIGLLSNALIAGVISAWVSDDGLHLALASAVFTVLAAGIWAWYQREARRHAGTSAPSPQIHG